MSVVPTFCPKCSGSIQKEIRLDADDKPVFTTYICKDEIPKRKKKGCGYTKRIYEKDAYNV